MDTQRLHTKNGGPSFNPGGPQGGQRFGLTVLEAENPRSPNRLKIKILFINPYLLIPKWPKPSKSDQN